MIIIKACDYLLSCQASRWKKPPHSIQLYLKTDWCNPSVWKLQDLTLTWKMVFILKIFYLIVCVCVGRGWGSISKPAYTAGGRGVGQSSGATCDGSAEAGGGWESGGREREVRVTTCHFHKNLPSSLPLPTDASIPATERLGVLVRESTLADESLQAIVMKIWKSGRAPLQVGLVTWRDLPLLHYCAPIVIITTNFKLIKGQ